MQGKTWWNVFCKTVSKTSKVGFTTEVTKKIAEVGFTSKVGFTAEVTKKIAEVG